jgi:hypothetical protein
MREGASLPSASASSSARPTSTAPGSRTSRGASAPAPRSAPRGEHVAKLLDAFDEVWDALVPEERREVLHALIERVGVDPESGTLRVTFQGLREAVLGTVDWQEQRRRWEGRRANLGPTA